MTGNATKLNPTQLYLLKLFSCNPSEETMNDLKDILTNYYAKIVEKEADKVWEKLDLNPEKLDEIL